MAILPANTRSSTATSASIGILVPVYTTLSTCMLSPIFLILRTQGPSLYVPPPSPATGMTHLMAWNFQCFPTSLGHGAPGRHADRHIISYHITVYIKSIAGPSNGCQMDGKRCHYATSWGLNTTWLLLLCFNDRTPHDGSFLLGSALRRDGATHRFWQM